MSKRAEETTKQTLLLIEIIKFHFSLQNLERQAVDRLYLKLSCLHNMRMQKLINSVRRDNSTVAARIKQSLAPHDMLLRLFFLNVMLIYLLVFFFIFFCILESV